MIVANDMEFYEKFPELWPHSDMRSVYAGKPDADRDGFEEPLAAELTVSQDDSRVERAVDKIIELLGKRGQVDLG